MCVCVCFSGSTETGTEINLSDTLRVKMKILRIRILRVSEKAYLLPVHPEAEGVAVAYFHCEVDTLIE